MKISLLRGENGKRKWAFWVSVTACCAYFGWFYIRFTDQVFPFSYRFGIRDSGWRFFGSLCWNYGSSGNYVTLQNRKPFLYKWNIRALFIGTHGTGLPMYYAHDGSVLAKDAAWFALSQVRSGTIQFTWISINIAFVVGFQHCWNSRGTIICSVPPGHVFSSSKLQGNCYLYTNRPLPKRVGNWVGINTAEALGIVLRGRASEQKQKWRITTIVPVCAAKYAAIVVNRIKDKVSLLYSVVVSASSWWGRVGGMSIESRQVRKGKPLELPSRMKTFLPLPAAGIEPTVLHCGFRSTTPDRSATESVISDAAFVLVLARRPGPPNDPKRLIVLIWTQLPARFGNGQLLATINYLPLAFDIGK